MGVRMHTLCTHAHTEREGVPATGSPVSLAVPFTKHRCSRKTNHLKQAFCRPGSTGVGNRHRVEVPVRVVGRRRRDAHALYCLCLVAWGDRLSFHADVYFLTRIQTIVRISTTGSMYMHACIHLCIFFPFLPSPRKKPCNASRIHMQRNAIECNAIQFRSIQHRTTQYNTMRYIISILPEDF